MEKEKLIKRLYNQIIENQLLMYHKPFDIKVSKPVVVKFNTKKKKLTKNDNN